METKVCTTCKQEKPVSDFHRNNNKKDGRSSQCKECVADYQRNRYRKNAGTIRKERREREHDMKLELEWYRRTYPQEGKPWRN